MSQVELLTRAIEKLETLKQESTPGPWEGWKQRVSAGSYRYGIEARGVDVAQTYSMAETELIEVLHRTIDPILEVLRLGVLYFEGDPSLRLGVIASVDHAVALAHAVLGDDV